ncbi:hypothetical protein BOTBODRAFT_186888 [Botryobasidium botryosum FD-172 SS1]|uniref:Uncharacterized protein n=1 Tax=Botryobasidium botryosum (strain FD-172 SS1) TaxID=930990 RepID=A0A067MWE1_BOTB1|nr:hypothetical protein BOTBODRAFT_186888 [Botryobasidium botryosum FD-172 SS1]
MQRLSPSICCSIATLCNSDPVTRVGVDHLPGPLPFDNSTGARCSEDFPFFLAPRRTSSVEVSFSELGGRDITSFGASLSLLASILDIVIDAVLARAENDKIFAGVLDDGGGAGGANAVLQRRRALLQFQCLETLGDAILKRVYVTDIFITGAASAHGSDLYDQMASNATLTRRGRLSGIDNYPRFHSARIQDAHLADSVEAQFEATAETGDMDACVEAINSLTENRLIASWEDVKNSLDTKAADGPTRDTISMPGLLSWRQYSDNS